MIPSVGLSWALSAHICQIVIRSITTICIWLQIDQNDRMCSAISNLDCTSRHANDIGLLWPALPTSENVRGLNSLHWPNPIPFSGWYLLQTSASINCKVGNCVQDIAKSGRDAWMMLEARCKPNDLWEVTKRWTSFVQLSETNSKVEQRHGSEFACEPIWVGSQP